jgi:hypothetical protein
MKTKKHLITLKENGVVALVAIGLLSVIFFIDYLTWFA